MAASLPSKRGRGRPPTDIHRRVVVLYRNGKRPADIARALQVTEQRVSAILKRAGIDPFADARRLTRQADANFRAVWEAAPELATAAERLGMTAGQAKAKAAQLRHRGMRLKRFPATSRTTKAAAIVAHYQQGMTALEIIRRGLGNRATVYAALMRFKPAGSNAGRVWTAEEDALLAKLSDAEIVARSGRKISAVTRRRETLRSRRT